jgi:hypothetical protein
MGFLRVEVVTEAVAAVLDRAMLNPSSWPRLAGCGNRSLVERVVLGGGL